MNNLEYLAELAKGFRSFDPWHLVALGVVGFLFAGLFAAYRFTRERKGTAGHGDGSPGTFETRVAALGLSPEDRYLLGKMAGADATDQNRTLLLENPGFFLSALSALRKMEEVDESSVSQLVGVLGLDESTHRGPLRSTRDLVEGMSVYLLFPGQLPCSGTVSTGGKNLKIALTAQAGSPGDHGGVILVFLTQAGLHRAKVNWVGVEGRVHEFEHTHRWMTWQRRRSFRKKLNLPIHIHTAGPGGKARVSKMLNLSLTGGSLENPDSSLVAGEDLQIVFGEARGPVLRLEACVKKTSRQGAVLHVQFGALKPGNEAGIKKIMEGPSEQPFKKKTGGPAR